MAEFVTETLAMPSKDFNDQRWIWRNHIPHYRLTLVSGDWSAGKTRTMANIVARVLLHEPFPDGNVPEVDPGHVLIVTTESEQDELESVFAAQGCSEDEIGFIHRLSYVKVPGIKDHFQFDLDRNLDALAKEIKKYSAFLVIFDPLVQFHTRKDNDSHAVRGLMDMLHNFCTTHRVAMIALQHWNKNEKMGMSNRTSGSHQYAASPKTVISIYRDLKDKNKRIFHQDKNNLGFEPPDLGFSIEQPDGLVVWSQVEGIDDTFEVVQAQKWLLENLHNPLPIQTCYELSGFGDRTLRTARNRLGTLVVTSEHFVGYKMVAHWELIGPGNNWGAFQLKTS